MIRYGLKLTISVALLVVLGGCWNYEGLNTLDIVTGMAVDKDENTGKYQLVFEIVDTSPGLDSEMNATYVEAEGDSLFEAIRNSKKRLIKKIYGGNMQTTIVSRQIAEKVGVSNIVEELLRDGEPRETLSIVVSEEDTAREILLTDGIDSEFVAYEIHDMIKEDYRITAATINMPLYQAYNAIKGKGNALVLPSIRRITNNGEHAAEVNGIALFDKDRLIGFLPAAETKMFLFITNRLKGGALVFPVSKPDEQVSVEIKDSRTATKVEYQKDKVLIHLDVKVKLNVMEMNSRLDIAEDQQREELESLAAKEIKEGIERHFKMIQNKYKVDIFGLGRFIYRKDPALWSSIEKDWADLFAQATLYVQVETDIVTSGVLKTY